MLDRQFENRFKKLDLKKCKVNFVKFYVNAVSLALGPLEALDPQKCGGVRYATGKISATSNCIANEKNRKKQRSEDAAEQYAARLEDACLRAKHLLFTISSLLCSRQKEYNRLRMAEIETSFHRQT
ncbi:hypothetical protein TNCV_2333521 [Trichonephila clavipes]|nr:hypothetical protein TNCV_2333521 [Trichonephila clavipes]